MLCNQACWYVLRRNDCSESQRYKIGDDVIPWRLKQAFKPWQFKIALKLLNPEMPSSAILRWLHNGWSNEGWSGDLAYLEAVWRETLNARRVLECGSGLSTILLGRIADRTGAEIWSLEHLSEWQRKVNDVLANNKLPNRVTYAPLRSYGTYEWYTLPSDLPSDFDLVICDGPPSATRGGRYGLLPVCADRITNAKILLDDVERPEEQAILRDWKQEFQFDGSIEGTPGECFAVISRML